MNSGQLGIQFVSCGHLILLHADEKAVSNLGLYFTEMQALEMYKITK